MLTRHTDTEILSVCSSGTVKQVIQAQQEPRRVLKAREWRRTGWSFGRSTPSPTD